MFMVITFIWWWSDSSLIVVMISDNWLNVWVGFYSTCWYIQCTMILIYKHNYRLYIIYITTYNIFLRNLGSRYHGRVWSRYWAPFFGIPIGYECTEYNINLWTMVLRGVYILKNLQPNNYLRYKFTCKCEQNKLN